MGRKRKTSIIIKDEQGNIIKNREGRPAAITPDVLQKLEDAFANSFSDKEACFYAGISTQTLYNFQKKYPEYVERKEALKLSPNMVAKRELVSNIKGNLDQARWWAQNKMSNEFGPKTEPAVSLTQVKIETLNLGVEVKEAVKSFNEAMRKQLTAKPVSNG